MPGYRRRRIGPVERSAPDATMAASGRAEMGPQDRADRWFGVCVALFVILLSVVGFWPSIIDASRRNAPPTPVVMAHGAVAGAWLLLFLTQSTLVATRRVAVHRKLGVIGRRAR